MVRPAIPGAPAQIYHANGRRGRDTFHITRLCAGGFTMEVHKLGPTVVATNGRSGAALEGVLWSPGVGRKGLAPGASPSSVA